MVRFILGLGKLGLFCIKRSWLCGKLGGIGGLGGGEKFGKIWKYLEFFGKIPVVFCGSGVRNWVCFA